MNAHSGLRSNVPVPVLTKIIHGKIWIRTFLLIKQASRCGWGVFFVWKPLFVCLFVYLFILGRKLNRQNCLLKEVLREREEKEEKEKKKSN